MEKSIKVYRANSIFTQTYNGYELRSSMERILNVATPNFTDDIKSAFIFNDGSETGKSLPSGYSNLVTTHSRYLIESSDFRKPNASEGATKGFITYKQLIEYLCQKHNAKWFIDNDGNLMSGFSTKTFDCSSFVQYCFYKGADIKLQTYSRAQSVEGQLVSKMSDLQRGDIVFMTSTARYYKTGLERIGHVDIYLGDGKMLHTFGTPGVLVDDFDAFWKEGIFCRESE